MANNSLEIREKLLQLFAEATLTDSKELDTEADLASIGVDSILAAQIAKLLSKAFSIEFSPVLLFEQISITGVEQYLYENLIHQDGNIADVSSEKMVKAEPSEVADLPELSANDVVIVGMACRFSQIDSIDEFWQAILAGKPLTRTTERWGAEGDKYVGGFLEGIDQFDANFFQISPAEAVCMDPQQRLLMQVVQHSIDDSLVSVPQLKVLNCGVFTTSLPGDYKFELANSPDQAFSSYSFSGNAFSTLSGRISYFYDFHGPSISLDTACSSGITALHQAVRHMQADDCEAAIVAGSTLFSTPEIFHFSAAANMSSPRGKCSAFSCHADGFVPAEGVASIVLTTAGRAHELALPIYASIAAIGSNHDGKSNGLMAPNAQSQRKLLEGLYQRNNIPLSQLAYLETHGTGTQLGDPIEMKGLVDAFESLKSEQKLTHAEVYLGAGKHVVGHTLVASGLASIIKLALCFKADALPAYYPEEKTNELLSLGDFKFVQEVQSWPDDKPFAAVNAFGFTGSNAHVVLHRPASTHVTGSVSSGKESLQSSPLTICLSAASQAGLRAVLQQCLEKLSEFDKVTDAVALANNLLRRPKYAEFVIIQDNNIAGVKSQIKQLLSSDKPFENSAVNHQIATDSLACYWLNDDVESLTQALPKAVVSAQHKLSGYPFQTASYWVTTQSKTQPAQILSNKTSASETLHSELQNVEFDKDTVLNSLIGQIAELMGFESSVLSAKTKIDSLGLDSLSAITLLAPYKNAANPLQAHDLFAFDTLESIAKAIADRFSETESSVSSSKNQTSKNHIPISSDTAEPGIEWLSVGGDGKDPAALLLMPPLNTDEVAWKQQIAFVRAQQPHRRIFIPRYPGHRKEKHNAVSAFSPESFSLQALANSVALFIQKELRGEPVDYVGWSLGGCLGLMIAQQHAQLLRKLVLVSCSAHYDETVFESTLDLHAELERCRDQLDIVLQHPDDPVAELSTGAPMQVLKYYYDELMRFDVRDGLTEIATPTLIIHGEQDAVIHNSVIDVLAGIPGSHVVRLTSHGHFSPLTAGRHFNTPLMNFIQDS